MAKITPITFDPQGAFTPQNGITREQLDAIAPQLLAARDEVLKTDLDLFVSNSEIPADKQPLDAGFLEMPERLLDAYQSDRDRSELGRILNTAARIRDAVDKVVVLGIGGSYMGARALMETCCQPYFNEYSRAERGGRPRMYFEGNNVDNDWSQALLHFLQVDSQGDGPLGKWAIVVISKSGGTLETASAFRQFLAALETAGGHRKPATVRRTGHRCDWKTGGTGRRNWLRGSFSCPRWSRGSILRVVARWPAARSAAGHRYRQIAGRCRRDEFAFSQCGSRRERGAGLRRRSITCWKQLKTSTFASFRSGANHLNRPVSGMTNCWPKASASMSRAHCR